MGIGADIFYRTATWAEAEDILKTHGRVLLTGLPGSGKRTLAQGLQRAADSRNIIADTVKTFKEWRERVGGGRACGDKERRGYDELSGSDQISSLPSPSPTHIVFLDHIFGSEMLQPKLVNKWERVFDIMLKFCEERKVLLIFTFYPHVLTALRELFPESNLFSSLCEVQMMAPEYEEKEGMLLQHLRHEDRFRLLKFINEGYIHFQPHDILENDDSGSLFPECCRRFVASVNCYCQDDDLSLFERYIRKSEKIFSRPSPIFKDFFFRVLALQTNDSWQEKVITAFCLLLAKVNTMDRARVNEFCSKNGLGQHSLLILQTVLKKFRGTLVSEDCQQFVSRHAYEGTALALAKEHPALVLQVVDWLFLIRRCIVPTSKQAIDDYLKPYFIVVKRMTADRKRKTQEYTALVERISLGLQNPSEVVFAVQHAALQTHEFIVDIQTSLGDADALYDMLTGTRDSTHNMSVLYWSLFNPSVYLVEFVFKKAFGRHSKQDLVLCALACCVLADKANLLTMFLKYWKTATKEQVGALLQGKLQEMQGLTMPLPRRGIAVSDSWKDQVKHITRSIGAACETASFSAGVDRLCSTSSSSSNTSGGSLDVDACTAVWSSETSQPSAHGHASAFAHVSSEVQWAQESFDHPQHSCSEARRHSVPKSNDNTVSNKAQLKHSELLFAEPVQGFERQGEGCSLTQDTQSVRLPAPQRPKGGKRVCVNVSQPPLHLAVRFSNSGVVKLLASQYPAALSIQDSCGRTALHAAVHCANVKMVETLLVSSSEKSFISKLDHLGNSALHEAYVGGHEEIVQLLEEAGPHLKNVQNNAGDTPADVAVMTLLRYCSDYC